MKRVSRVSLLFLFIFPVLLIGASFLFGKELKAYIQRRFTRYAVEGVVKDISTEAALELVEVYVNGNPTFTNHEGKFYVGNLEEFPLVRMRQESDFEDYKFAFACSESGRLGFFTEKVICEASLVPTLETTITRVASSFVSPQKQHDIDVERRYWYLWRIMHPDSWAEWSSADNYVAAMKQRETALWDYEYNLVAVKPYSEPVMLDFWTDPLTGKTYSSVAEVVFETESVWGIKAYPKEHFIKAGGFWRYFGTYNEEEVNEVIKRHAEYLKRLTESGF